MDEIVWLEAQSQVTMVEVARCSGLPETTVRELVEFGALTAQDDMVSGACIGRLRVAGRLASDFELDTAAMGLVLRYLERIEALEAEVQKLKAVGGRR